MGCMVRGPLFEPGLNRMQRLGQRRAMGTARLCHVGPSPTLAANLLSDVVDELARLDP